MSRNYTEVEVARFNRILNRLSDESMVDLSRFDLIISASGGKTRKFYADLATDTEVEILKTGHAGPSWLRFLSSFIPMEGGLVRILTPRRLKPLFEDLGAMRSCEIFYIPRELTSRIVEHIFKRDRKALRMLEEHGEYMYLKAELDDFVQHEPDYYYLYDYRIGPETAAVIKTVFNGL